MITKAFHIYKNTNLILQIIIGIVLGALIGAFSPALSYYASMLGDLFIGALKAIAPVLVFILILTSISTKTFSGQGAKMRTVVLLYLVATFLASLCAVIASFIYPVSLVLEGVTAASNEAAASLGSVFKELLFKIVDNPINALISGNYLGILAWSIGFGIALRHSKPASKELFTDINEGVLKVVAFIVKLAPFGILGLVANSAASTGAAGLLSYGKLLALLVLTMLFVALIINPLIAFIMTRKNPFPLVFACIKSSAIFAFFTRSSAANIPVNMALCERLGVEKNLYSISIPIGATINMGGAAVTIGILSLAAAHTLGIQVSFIEAFLLSIVATFAACGASGVAGGSLLLVPLACSFFNIDYDTAMKVVGVGFVIGVVQDSLETAINSSTDALFTAVASKDELNLK